jgi:hypothetical protein
MRTNTTDRWAVVEELVAFAHAPRAPAKGRTAQLAHPTERPIRAARPSDVPRGDP